MQNPNAPINNLSGHTSVEVTTSAVMDTPITPAVTPVMSPTTVKKSSSKLILIISIILVLLIVVIIVVQALIKPQPSSSTANITATPSQTQIATTDNLQLSTFTGKYLSAQLPKDWTIIELENGIGNDSISGNKVTGLTGVQIENSDGVTLFRIDAMSGIGGTTMCYKIYKFNDTPQAYIDARIDNNNANWVGEAGGTPNPPEIIDLSDTTYTQIELLGHAIRIIGTTIYWNDNNYSPQFNNTFVPMCEEDGLGFPGLADISFASPSELNDHNYSAKIVGNPTEANMSALKMVLISLKVK